MEKKTTIEELILESAELKARLKSEKESSQMWYKKAMEIEQKFNAFREMIKGLVILIEK